MTRRQVGVFVAGVALLVATALYGPGLFDRWWLMLFERGWVGPLHARGTVVFVVLDTVRADHTSLCGYDRPTTPNLDALAGEGIHTCRAYAPGTWTLPSHASYFTGVAMLDHGAHDIPVPSDELEQATYAQGTGIPIAGLGPELPTLAEQFAARGYQTRIVSANPVLGKASGLLRGFEHGFVPKGFGQLAEEAAVGRVAEVVRALDPVGGPLFLFVNLTEAHQPWKAVPKGVGWLPPRAGISYMGKAAKKQWIPFFSGELQGPAREEFLAKVTDVYDYGIWRADRTMGAVLAGLRGSGWCAADCRVVVASDHGEMIGEHGLIDHGFYPWEANARVMVVATGVEQGGLPEPLAGELVHDLVLDGRIAHGPTNPTEAAFGHPHRAGNTGGRFFTERTAAFWQGTDKWVWLGSTLARFDLAADPSEARPLPADPEPPAFTALRARVENFVASKRGDDALREQLEAAGYLEPEAENDPDESTSDAVDEPTTTPGGEMGGRPP